MVQTSRHHSDRQGTCLELVRNRAWKRAVIIQRSIVDSGLAREPNRSDLSQSYDFQRRSWQDVATWKNGRRQHQRSSHRRTSGWHAGDGYSYGRRNRITNLDHEPGWRSHLVEAAIQQTVIRSALRSLLVPLANDGEWKNRVVVLESRWSQASQPHSASQL